MFKNIFYFIISVLVTIYMVLKLILFKNNVFYKICVVVYIIDAMTKKFIKYIIYSKILHIIKDKIYFEING